MRIPGEIVGLPLRIRSKTVFALVPILTGQNQIIDRDQPEPAALPHIMHPPPNDRPTGKKESDGEKNHADFREKRALPFLWRKKASFKKAKHGAHHQLQNNRQENEMPKLLPSSPTRKRCVLFKRLEEVVHLLYVNFLRLLAREPFLQLPPSTCCKVSSLRRSYPCSTPKTVRLPRLLSGLRKSACPDQSRGPPRTHVGGTTGFVGDW